MNTVLNEKEINELAEKIIEAISSMLFGKQPGLLSGSVQKKVQRHSKKSELIKIYKDFILQNNGEYSSMTEWETLAKFRFKIVEVYLQDPEV